jgi:nucleotidyltransferase/DNA polymerase involved in DNA repair
MDAFFASVEQLDNPELRGKPIAVGGPSEGRGVVSAASYEARAFGVHSAMPMGRAQACCPHLIVLPGRMERYQEVSGQIMEVFHRFSPLVEPLSVDEAFLDITGSQRLLGSPEEIGPAIKKAIREEIGLTASVGIAPTKFMAKIASDLEKPDGLVIIHEEEMLDRLAALPVGKLWGVGPKMEGILHQNGIRSVADLRGWPQAALQKRWGETGDHLYRLSHGLDFREVEVESEVKSVSHETTFHEDIDDLEELKGELRYLADKVAYRMRAQGVEGRVVFIKVRYADFSTVTRRVTLKSPSALAAVMMNEGVRLLEEKTDAGARAVRLIGIGMGNLSEEGRSVQTSLFLREGEPDRDKQEAIERATDAIKNRMGKHAIGRAVYLDRPEENLPPE